jgi:hypothetical protein
LVIAKDAAAVCADTMPEAVRAEAANKPLDDMTATTVGAAENAVTAAAVEAIAVAAATVCAAKETLLPIPNSDTDAELANENATILPMT